MRLVLEIISYCRELQCALEQYINNVKSSFFMKVFKGVIIALFLAIYVIIKVNNIVFIADDYIRCFVLIIYILSTWIGLEMIYDVICVIKSKIRRYVLYILFLTIIMWVNIINVVYAMVLSPNLICLYGFLVLIMGLIHINKAEKIFNGFIVTNVMDCINQEAIGYILYNIVLIYMNVNLIYVDDVKFLQSVSTRENILDNIYWIIDYIFNNRINDKVLIILGIIIFIFCKINFVEDFDFLYKKRH